MKSSARFIRPALPPPLARYGSAVLMAGAAVLATWALQAFLHPGVFLFFYPAVVAAAWYGGFGPGVLVAVGGVLMAELVFLAPGGPSAVDFLENGVFVVTFVALAGVVSVLVSRTHQAQRLALSQAAESQELAARLAEQGALLDEHARNVESRAAELQAAMEAAHSARREAEAAYARSETERRRVNILAETSRALSESREYEQRLHALAQLVTRELADYCVIDVRTESGALKRLAAARDPAHQELIDQAHSFVPDPAEPSAVADVLRTGQPLIVLHTDPDQVVAGARSPEHARFLEELALTSVIVMPLAVAQRRLGSIAVMRSGSSPDFEAADVELVRVLATRAALLIEAAGLYHEARLELARRERAEDSLREKSLHLEALNLAQQRMLSQLAERTQQAEQAERAALEASQAKSQFLAVMSHELRTPLNAIMGYTDLLQSGAAGAPLAERERGYLDRIRASVLHLRGLIDEVLSLSRIEAGREEVALEKVPLGQLVEDVAAMMHRQALDKGLALNIEVEGDVVITTDPGKVRQILLNLASNAVKFTDHGEVRLGLRAAGGLAELEVSDTGVGIPPEYHSRIFEPFTQADQSRTRRAGGSGLGLSVSRKLALLLGGELSFESAPGQGTRFTLSLPLTEPLAALR